MNGHPNQIGDNPKARKATDGLSRAGASAAQPRSAGTTSEGDAWLHALLAHSPVAILSAAPDGRVFSANPKACQMFGRPEAEICRLGRAGLVDARDGRLAKLIKQWEQAGFASGELHFLRADGTTFLAEVTSAEYETRDGTRTSMVVRDLSARQAAEDHVRDFSRQLLSAREEERRRISTILHHETGSFLIGFTARLNAVRDDLAAGRDAQAMDSLLECKHMLRDSIQHLKALAVELRPPDLDLLGLSAALRQYFQKITKETAIGVRFVDCVGGAVIPPDIQICLFRAAQESLNNVVRHADTRLVKVRLSAPAGRVRLAIADDGKGFEPHRTITQSGRPLGLRTIKEMVAALAGEVEVVSAPGRGAKIRIDIPVPREST